MTAGETVAWLDVTAGVAGDMLLGALVDAGLPLASLEEIVHALRLDGVRLEARKVRKGALSATKVDVRVPGAPAPAPESIPVGTPPSPPESTSAVPHDHPASHADAHPRGHATPHAPGHGHGQAPPPPSTGLLAPVPSGGAAHGHRTLRDVLAIVRGAKGLPAEGVADAVRTFTLLAEAEGRVHGIPPDAVHFHEVGALDAIVDVVGTCVGLRRLGVLEVRASALPWFGGSKRMAHGVLPLPAPAVTLLYAGLPTFPSDETHEQVTPTGAALVRALARGSATPPGFVPRAVGLGAGDHPGGRLPNVVRLVLGEVIAGRDVIDAIVLETNLDDATGQEVSHAIERALASGALDAWAAPVTMKKGRPGVVLSVLCAFADAPALEQLLFRETPTLGIRRHPVARTVLLRRNVPVTTPFGPIHVKVRAGPDGDEGTPEYEECRLAGERAGVSWRVVAGSAIRSWEASRGA